jgi:hypothetical protein
MGAKNAVARRNEALELLAILEGSDMQSAVPFAARLKSRRASMLSESLRVATGIQHILAMAELDSESEC